MSRLLLPNRFSATCPMLSARDSALLVTLRAGARAAKQQQSVTRGVFTQQQRRYVSRPDTVFSRHRAKSWVWMCGGVGAGVALAVGLKYRSDTINSSCGGKVAAAVAERTDRYSAAVRVSRDLVDRIKVGTEVGPLSTYWLLYWPACIYSVSSVWPQWHLCQFSVVCVCVLSGRGGCSWAGGGGLCGWCSGLVWRLVPLLT